jgi:hypothetical protein
MIAYIDANRDRFGVVPICTVLSTHGMPIAPSTYYAIKARGASAAELADAYAANAIPDAWRANRGIYGVRKMWHLMRRAGWNLGRDQVARLMGIVGIAGVIRGQHRTITTRRDERAPRHPDLIQRAWDVPKRPDLGRPIGLVRVGVDAFDLLGEPGLLEVTRAGDGAGAPPSRRTSRQGPPAPGGRARPPSGHQAGPPAS